MGGVEELGEIHIPIVVENGEEGRQKDRGKMGIEML